MKKIKQILSGLLLGSLCLVSSCQSDFDKILPNDGFDDSSPVEAKSQKVLYLIVDGARGWTVRDVKSPNITSLLRYSTYSWNALSDSVSTNVNGWADLMTGVNKNKHEVATDNISLNKFNEFPVFFKRIKENKADIRIASFAANADFKNYLTTDADKSESFTSDVDVKNAIVAELGKDEATVVVGQFGNVSNVGISYSYESDDVNYKNAILEFDNQVGEILTALRLRQNYSKENWLVVITSSHGGEATIPSAQNDNTVFSYPKANTFTIIYNPSFKQKLISKPFTGSLLTGRFLRFYSSVNNGVNNNAVRATLQNSINNDLYNFGDTGQFTLELKVKKLATYPRDPGFFGKKFTMDDAQGWNLFMRGAPGAWRFNVSSKGNVQYAQGEDIPDQNWHHLTIKVFNQDFRRKIQTYTDGRPGAVTTLPVGYGNIDNPEAPLTIGFLQNSSNPAFNGLICDVRMWKAALPDAIVKQYSCDVRITETHPYWDTLIGYWPADEGSGTTLKDLSAASNDFTVNVGSTTTLQWTDNTSIICPLLTGNLVSLVPNNVDLPRQILSWLTIPTPETWNLDGRVWLNQ